MYWGGDLHAILAQVWDCDILVSKFEFLLCYYVHFWANAPWERYEPSLIPPDMG